MKSVIIFNYQQNECKLYELHTISLHSLNNNIIKSQYNYAQSSVLYCFLIYIGITILLEIYKYLRDYNFKSKIKEV